MRNLMKSVLIIIFITLLQLTIYDLFLKPAITTWGATAQEISMPMAGDDKALTITSTRAISINATQSVVWQWLIQLGADRGGFYSYDFIEEALGYKTRQQHDITPQFKTLAVGDVVRGSIDEKSSIIPYNFRVLYVKPEDFFVLDKWGTFLLQPVSHQQTRLIIRTQEIAGQTFYTKIANYIGVPLHFIMERKTLLGIKARAEAGEGLVLSNNRDIAWFCGIVLCGFFIIFSIFIGRGAVHSIVIPAVFSTVWLLTILIFAPIPIYSIGLLFITCSYVGLHYIKTRKINTRNS